MTTREVVVEAVTDWIFPRDADHGHEVLDVEGGRHPFGRDWARWAVERLPDAVLTPLATAANRLPTAGAGRLVARLAAAHAANDFAAAGDESGPAAETASESLRLLGNVIVFADVLDAALASGALPQGPDSHRLGSIFHTTLQALEPGRANGWWRPDATGPRSDWLAADEDERDEARARALLLMHADDLSSPSREMVAFVVANLHRPVELAMALEQRPRADVGSLSAVLDAETPALAEGAL